MDLVSIIIPVYNTEKYLKCCIESILSQTYSNIELILVNDGSFDQSLKVCREYELRDSRVKVLDKKNEGVSIARNAGIIEAKGKYLQFVDSDDYIDENMTELMVNSIKKYNSDMVICGINSFDERKLRKKNKNREIIRTDRSKNYYTIHEFLEVLLKFKTDVFFGSPDNKLFKKELIYKNRLMFRPGINFAEDFLFNIEYFKYLNSVSVVNKSLYHYRRNVQNSITKIERNTEELWIQFKNIFETYKQTFKELRNYEENIEKINSFMILAFIVSIWNCNKEYPNLLSKKKVKIVKALCEDAIITEIQEKIFDYSKNESYIVYLLKKKKYLFISFIYSVKFIIYISLKKTIELSKKIQKNTSYVIQIFIS